MNGSGAASLLFHPRTEGATGGEEKNVFRAIIHEKKESE
jgi:hypothetical protein